MGLDISLYIGRKVDSIEGIFLGKIQKRASEKLLVSTQIGDFRKCYPLINKVEDHIGRSVENCEYVHLDIEEFQKIVSELVENIDNEKDWHQEQIRELQEISKELEEYKGSWDYWIEFWAWW